MDPVPFIVGAPRSGTTLLRAMLQMHPDLAIPFESHFIVPALCDDRLQQGDVRAKYLAGLAREPRFQAWNLPIGAVEESINRRGACTVVELIGATFMAAATGQGKRRWGDKTPAYALHVGLLGRSFPSACMIHLVRDPRSVVASYLGTPIGPRRADLGAVTWDMHTHAARLDGRELGVGRYIEVRYEQLVLEPEEVLRKICDLLRLEYTPRMLQYYKEGKELIKPARSPAAHQNLSRKLDPSLAEWRSRLSGSQIRIIESCIEQEMQTFGYQRTSRKAATDRIFRALHVARRAMRDVRSSSRVKRRRWRALDEAIA